MLAARRGYYGAISLVVPGVSFTYMKRDLPTTTIVGTSSKLSFTMADASIKTNAWRLVASKSLILFGLAAGVGQDSYDEEPHAASIMQPVGLILE